MAKSAWIKYLADFRKKNPNMSVPEAAKAASKTYKKQAGGSALGVVSPSDFTANPNAPSTGTALQVKSTLYSGGAKKSRRSKSKSHRKSHRKSRSRRGGEMLKKLSSI